MLNIGLGDATAALLARASAPAAALGLYRRFIAGFAHAVHGLDPEDFEALARRRCRRRRPRRAALRGAARAMLALFEEETGDPWPQDPAEQLEAAARAMARGLERRLGAHPAPGQGRARGGRPRPRRPAPGARPRPRRSAAPATLQLVDSRTGAPELRRRLPPRRPGHRRPPAGAAPDRRPRRRRAPRSRRLPRRARRRSTAAADPRPPPALGDAYQLEFAVEDGEVAILDAVPVRRNARAAVRIAVDLANAGAITRAEALLRIEPRSLIEHLHPQIDPAAPRDVFATGLAASPGAATGRIVFTAEAAQAAAAQDEATILVRARDQPRGHPRHARRPRRPDRARRHDQPRRGDRPRPRPALRRRRRRAAPRPRRPHPDQRPTAASSARAR